MRVLIATSTFPLRPDDGTPRFVLDLALALARHAEVTVLAPGAPGAPARDRFGALDVRRFDYFLPRRAQRLAYGAGMPTNLEASRWARAQVPAFVACEARALGRLARELRADVVHSQWILPQGLAAAWARGSERRFAHVATMHGSDAHLLARLPAARPLARWLRARSDAVIASGASLRTRFERTLGRASQAITLPVGVDTEWFRTPSNESMRAPFPDGFLLFVGRLVPIKGVEVLLRALPLVRDRHPGLGLIVIGDGPLASSLRRSACELGLEKWVHFAGRAGRAAVAAHLRACRAAVVPSLREEDGRSEGMPSVVLEAMAAGARLVATDAGGVPDVVKAGRNGWLARPGDPVSLATALLEALDAPRPPALRETADAHDWARVAERHLEIYEGALRGAPA